MPNTRREFMRFAALGVGSAAASRWAGTAGVPAAAMQTPADATPAPPILRRGLWPSPVRIASIEVLKAGEQFLVRVRSREGATGLAVGHPDVLETTWPILTRRIAPFFVGKDARDLERLLTASTSARTSRARPAAPVRRRRVRCWAGCAGRTDRGRRPPDTHAPRPRPIPERPPTEYGRPSLR